MSTEQHAGQHCCGADCPAENEENEETQAQQVLCTLLVHSLLQHMLTVVWQTNISIPTKAFLAAITQRRCMTVHSFLAT